MWLRILLALWCGFPICLTFWNVRFQCVTMNCEVIFFRIWWKHFVIWTVTGLNFELTLRKRESCYSVMSSLLSVWPLEKRLACVIVSSFLWNFMEMFHKVNNCQSWEGEVQHDHDDEQLVIHWFPIHRWAFRNWRVKFSTHLKAFCTLRLCTKEKGFNERLSFYRKLRMGVQVQGEIKLFLLKKYTSIKWGIEIPFSQSWWWSEFQLEF